MNASLACLEELPSWNSAAVLPNGPAALDRTAIAILLAMLALWSVAVVLRKVYFHPLSAFPGPRTAAFSNISYSISYLGGRQPFDVLNLHTKYGPAVRVAPNELSFNSAQAWKDIYAQRKGHSTFIKSQFYDGGNFANQAHSIVSERDPVKHAEMRRYLSGAFSDRSLKEQEYLVSGVIDRFIMQVEKLGSVQEGINMTLWFNLMTFDVIGELAFGKSFGGVESGAEHFWISTVLESMGQASLSDTLSRFPLLARIWMRLNPNWLKKLAQGSERHEGYTMDLIEKRAKEKTDRKDFMSYLLQDQEKNNLSTVQLAAHGSDFVIAGSETTATTLTVVTYFLGQNPHMLEKLQQEVRTAFRSHDEINGTSTGTLKYLHAVCLEALRIFPPLALGLPRVVSPGGDMVDNYFVPEGTIVSTNPFAASMSPSNFRDPWKFDPERWLGLNETDVLEASQPFSMGTRACLGRSLGWLELHTTLAKLHWKMDLTLLSRDVIWHRDAEMHLLWKKPAIFIKAKARAVVS